MINGMMNGISFGHREIFDVVEVITECCYQKIIIMIIMNDLQCQSENIITM